MISAAQPTSKDVAELHRVIDSLKTLVEQYKQENESLKKAGQSAVKYMEVVTQNKKLKQQVAELMTEVGAKAAESRSDVEQVPRAGQGVCFPREGQGVFCDVNM
jgi:division protein CdvB (Snf7/Vps24/ESCRT-III family)